MPCFDWSFAVHVNASDIVVGAILTWWYDQTDIHICYFSKQQNPTEAQ